MREGIASQEELVLQVNHLSQQLDELQHEKADLEILVETITEHSTDLENEIYEKNQQMLRYLVQVERVTAAAAAVESGEFEISSLNEVAARSDELGQLARVFQRMVEQVKVREDSLKKQVQLLRIEIDKSKQARQVAKIVETDSFKHLKQRLKKLKSHRHDLQDS